VTLFLAKLGLAEAPKRRDQSKQHLPKAKAQERAKAIAAAEAAAAETPAE
jgi:small subunit ribosomal protein S16